MKDFTSDSAYHKIVNIWRELLLFVIGKWNGGPVFFETRCIWATCRRTAHVHDVARHFSLLTSLSYLLRTFYLHNNVRVCVRVRWVRYTTQRYSNETSINPLTLNGTLKPLDVVTRGGLSIRTAEFVSRVEIFSYLRTYLTTLYVCHIARHVIEIFTQHR